MWVIPQDLGISFPSAPAARASTSASLWLFPMLSQSAGLNGKPSPSRSWCAAWKRASWMRLLAGRICGPSTAARGVGRWIASLRATRANRSVPPAAAVDETILAICGPKSPALSESLSRPLCCSKTCRDTSLWGCERSAKTWSNWVTRLRRACSRRRKSALRTNGSGCSSSAWPTTRAADAAGVEYQRDRGTKGLERASLTGLAQGWPTPFGMAGVDATGKAGQGGEFAKAVERWATPTQANHGPGADQSETQDGSQSLVGQTETWPTPASRDYRSPNAVPERDRGGGSKGEQLQNYVAFLYSRPAPAILPHGPTSSVPPRGSRPRLNPAFVCWLMGWPFAALGSSGYSATESCHYRRRMRSALCGLLSGAPTGSD